MALQEGQTLGQYQIINQLGQGGMATVYKAYHAKLDRYVAIKVMHPAFQDDGTFLARFEREAQIVARLEHPHIVPVYDFNEFEGQPYLVMKFIEGRTLKRILSAGLLSVDQILNIVTPIADALTYAHKRGVLHRDIKPSNIVLDKDDVPYLTDFGLARIAEAVESTMSADMILGTPQYISPEQANGERNLDARTDIYSLGVILYEMLVGRVPFNADTPYAIVHDHIYTPLPLPSELNPDIPPPVERVLLKALTKNPAERYNTPNEMVDALRHAVANPGVAEPGYTNERIPDEPPTMDIPKSKSVNVSIPIPNPPRPPNPPRVVISPPDPRSGKRRVEAEIDFSDLGRRVERGARRGARYIERLAETIEEAARERGPLTEEERIRLRIEKKFKKRQALLSHVTSFVLVNIMLWGIWFFSTQTDLLAFLRSGGVLYFPFPWPIFVTLGWGIGVFAHYFEYRNKYGAGADRVERMVQDEIERERARREGDVYLEKPKRDRRVRLTEDGELEEVTEEDEYSAAQKRKRR